MSGPVLAALIAQAAPLAACLAILCFLRDRKGAAAALAIGSVTVSLLASVQLVLAVAVPNLPRLAEANYLPIESGAGLTFGVMLDPLSTTMALVVAVVTLCVMVYSVGYMADDEGFARYFGFLALFAWAMEGLVLSSNLLQTLVFWELVGLASFLLIGFWYRRPEPQAAARKAFIMTRVGDVGFLFGILYLVRALGYATIPVLNTAAAGGMLQPREAATAAALLLMGAIGKSAQGPLFTWLPDAMEGPTPVSALLHSATMVAAGVFLVARLHPLFMAAPVVMEWLLWCAVITAVATATMAMVANDIKRVLAYSSISQLGYMFMGLAAGSLTAGYFHLVTHAGFKALLFLSSGIFIHHAHSNDMREIAKTGPRVRRAGVIGLVSGGAALAGIIPFSGYFSKEAVLAALGEHAGMAVVVLAYAGAGLTAYYTARMVFLTLFGTLDAGRAHGSDHPLHGERWMGGPVLFLSALTLVLGYLGGFLHARLAGEGAAEHGPFAFGAGPATALALVAAGIALAWVEFGRKGAARVGFVERMPALRDFFGNNWYVDRLYNATVVRLALALSRAAKWNDHTVLDGASDLVADGTIGGGRVLARLQTGYVQAYVATAVTLIAVLAAWLTGGAR